MGSAAAVRERGNSPLGGGRQKVAAVVCNKRCKQQRSYADDKQMLMGDLGVVEGKQMLSWQPMRVCL